VATSASGASSVPTVAATGDVTAELQHMLAATRLFNQLHERDARRSFGAQELWHWPAIRDAVLLPGDADDSSVAVSDEHDPEGAVAQLLGGGPLAVVMANVPQVCTFI
jgi:hypothetical protein